VTNVALTGEPRPDGGCRVCGTKLTQGSLVCAQCGTVHGERYRCPHCGAIADLEPSKALRYRCKVCGGPRVPSDDVAVKRSGSETPALERAQRAHRIATAWRVGAGVVAGFGGLSLLIALLVLGVVTPGVLGTLATLFGTLVPFVLAFVFWRRGGAEYQKVTDALDEAWQRVAAEVIAAHGGELTAAELAKTLRSDTSTAERMLARLGAHDFVRSRVTDAGDVVYSSPSAERVRVSPNSGTVVDATELGGVNDSQASAGNRPLTLDATEHALDEASEPGAPRKVTRRGGDPTR
jgi:hypothetical protein